MNYEDMDLDTLRALFKKANHIYYFDPDNKEAIPDSEFDKLFEVLKKKEAHLPSDEALTSKVNNDSNKTSKGLVIHQTPMQSIRTVIDTSEEGFKAFDTAVRRGLEIGDDVFINYIAEPKYDGMGLSLRYLDGQLKHMAIRGDGATGEDIIRNLYLFGRSFVPPMLPTPFSGEIRGEAMLGKMTFYEYNQFLERNNLEPKKNPRNAVAGAARTKVKVPFLAGALMFFPYSVIPSDSKISMTQSYALTWLQQMGFQLLESLMPKTYLYRPGCAVSPYNYYTDIKREFIGVEMDGVVYKVDNPEYQNKLGRREREPRWAAAQKFAPEEVTTRLLSVETTVGRTGVLTPVAKLLPAHINGVTVSSCILDNFFQTRRLDIRVGDFVILKRSGDTIPKITGRIKSRDGYVKNITPPGSCPHCDAPIVRAKGYREHYCINYSCKGRELGTLQYFVGRECMDIQGLGDISIRELYEDGHIRYPHDLFNLKIDILNATLGAKMATKVFYNIHGCVQVFDWKLLTAIGIPGMGVVSCKEFCLKHRLNIMGRVFDDFPEMTHYFQFAGKWDQFQELMRYFGKALTYTTGESVAHKGSIVFTGSFDFKMEYNFTRRELATKETAAGWKVTSNVSKTTTCLIVGTDPTPHKVERAKALGIPIYTYTEFKKTYP